MMSRPSQGFTLMEILVALVVMMILISSIGLSIGGQNINQKVKTEAQRLAAVLQVVQQEAIINSAEIGMLIDEGTYQFLLLEQGTWVPLIEDKLFELRELPDNMEFALAVDGFAAEILGKSDEDEVQAGTFTQNDIFEEEGEDGKEEARSRVALTPQVYLLSSGEMSPFVIHIGVEEEYEFYYRIEGFYDGRIKVDGPYEGNFRDNVALEPENEFLE